MRYDREKAVRYAREWALKRNPKYYNFDSLGGDCTNFVSQCLYEGINEMNYRGYGWYYINGNKKSPSWTGVEYLYNFLISNKYEGPRGIDTTLNQLEVGDLIQLSFNGIVYGHTLIVSAINESGILICAHTVDSKDRLLGTYDYVSARYIKIS